MHPDCSCNEPTCFGTADVGYSEECDHCVFWDACKAIDDQRIEEKKVAFIESLPCFGGVEFDTKVICDVCEAWGLCSHEYHKNRRKQKHQVAPCGPPDCFGTDFCEEGERDRSAVQWPPPQPPVKEKVKDMSHQVQKTFSVCTAHRLMDHPGACKNLHGHNYNITVYLEAEELNSQGMVIDFSDIKKKIGMLIDELYDHKTILQDIDPLVPVLFPYLSFNLQTTSCAPTAENMAQHTFSAIQQQLEHICPTVKVVRVDVEETQNSIAIYVE